VSSLTLQDTNVKKRRLKTCRYAGIDPRVKYLALARVLRLAANFVDAHDYVAAENDPGNRPAPTGAWELVARVGAYLSDFATDPDPAARVGFTDREEQ
jgi:hypothetical protein